MRQTKAKFSYGKNETFSISLNHLISQSQQMYFTDANFPDGGDYFSIRSSHWRCSVKKMFLEISQNSQKYTCARVSFLIKLQASQNSQKNACASVSFLIKFQAKMVSREFCEISNNFFIEHLRATASVVRAKQKGKKTKEKYQFNQFKVVNCFLKKAPLQMFNVALNTFLMYAFKSRHGHGL